MPILPTIKSLTKTPIKPTVPVKSISVSKPSAILKTVPIATSPTLSVNIILPTPKPKQLFSGLRTLAGGLKQKHTIEVVDRSNERLQLLPFQVHCETCGFEAKVKIYGEALTIAKGHVGL